jgi:phenylalanyl-tRNA synthetase beta chain
MPQSVLSYARVVEGISNAPSPARLTELLFEFAKAEVASVEGDRLTVEATPDRLDLLSEGGLKLYLEGLLGERVGLPPIPRGPPVTPEPAIRVDPSVDPIRPTLAAVRVDPPAGKGLDEGLLAEAIRFQEILHATLGLNRAAASLGIYPWKELTLPIHYRLEPIEPITFHPLDGDVPVPGGDFFRDHPLAAKYAPLGVAGDQCLVLRDNAGAILSLPPVLNSRVAGEARAGDGALLLESTGQRPARVEEALGLLLLPFVARGWSASPVPVQFPAYASSGEKFVRPRPVALPEAVLTAIGGSEIPAAEAAAALAKARLGAVPGSKGWTVEVPPWRPDIQSAVDAVEDLLLIRGLASIGRRLPPSPTRGRRLARSVLSGRMADRLLGLGFVPLFTTVLISEHLERTLGVEALVLRNPVSAEYSRVRPSLEAGLLGALARNVRHAYPQRVSEVGPVVVRTGSSEEPVRTAHHAAFAIAADGAGFAEAASIVDYLLRRLQVAGVREPAPLPGMIPGRAARLRLAGEPVAAMGEVHPEVLATLGIPVPVAWGEIDLSALGPLLAAEAK